MARIKVTEKERTDRGSVFLVEVKEEGGETEHVVTLREEYHKELTGGEIRKEDLIKKSFEFLLEREPKESILTKFDLSVIEEYFPEYGSVIRNS